MQHLGAAVLNVVLDPRGSVSVISFHQVFMNNTKYTHIHSHTIIDSVNVWVF